MYFTVCGNIHKYIQYFGNEGPFKIQKKQCKYNIFRTKISNDFHLKNKNVFFETPHYFRSGILSRVIFPADVFRAQSNIYDGAFFKTS